jgi:phage tail sheath protein FI
MPIYHGIKVTETTTGARAIASVASGIIGLVATAGAAVGAPTTALDAAFPIGELTLVTDVRSAIEKAGTTGTLAKALSAIADQCAPIIIVLRVAEGVDAAATQANIIADLPLLLDAESLLGVRPRILGIPGFDNQAVATALVPIAQQLRAFAYVAGVGDAVEDLITYRENFAAREMMLIWPEFTDWAGSAVARALGLRARIDEETGWHKTLSNVAVNGVTGIATAVPFDMVNSAPTAASLLNDAHVTTLIRANGFRFWGNRTCSDDPAWAFETSVRTAQILQDEIAGGLIWAIDKPLLPSLVKDILETINARFRILKTQGRIIGGRAWFDPAENPASNLAAGKLAIKYEFTDVAPAEAIGITAIKTDTFYADLAAQLG